MHVHPKYGWVLTHSHGEFPAGPRSEAMPSGCSFSAHVRPASSFSCAASSAEAELLSEASSSGSSSGKEHSYFIRTSFVHEKGWHSRCFSLFFRVIRIVLKRICNGPGMPWLSCMIHMFYILAANIQIICPVKSFIFKQRKFTGNQVFTLNYRGFLSFHQNIYPLPHSLYPYVLMISE